MIENIDINLSLAEKAKREARQRKRQAYLISLPAIILGSAGLTLFALFMAGHFFESFSIDQAFQTAAKFLIFFVVFNFLFIGVYEFSSPRKTAIRDFWLISIIIAIVYMAGLVTSVMLNMYAIPIILASLIIIELTEKKNATLAVGILAIMFLCTFTLTNTPEEFDYNLFVPSIIVNSLAAIFCVMLEKRHYTRLRFFLVAILVPLAVEPLTVLFTVANHDYSIYILWNVCASYAANVGGALVFMPLVAVFEGVFNIADDFKLNELCNLSNPLLKRLASEAPGTFNHSLVVGNLAEACASAIKENPNMARCGAYYHDIGKLKAPIYFSENQSTYNPHDELIPEVSVSMITSHTLFGEILAKNERLPKEIVDICRQHHGTSPVSYFYRKALTLKEEGDLAVDKYLYAGPKPQTKVAAIIMIADTIEAAMRAYMPDSKEEYEKRINMLIDEKVNNRQFDECPITMGDIAIIKKTIMEVLPSIHHSRIDYNKKKKL